MGLAASLPAQHPWVWSLAICIAAAATEGMLSGTQVKLRFDELKLPRPAFPLWCWFVIGAAYYVFFFFTVKSILEAPPTRIWTATALVLAIVLLAANAIWNLFFFRRKNLWLGFVLFLPYDLAALLFGFVLYYLRNPYFSWFLIYVCYLAYASWWGHRIWRLNSPPAVSSRSAD
jgi:tryptophan-rich sensory protein